MIDTLREVTPARAPGRPWHAGERLAALQETHGLAGEALAAWCRERGVRPEDLAAWRATFCENDEQVVARQKALRSLNDAYRLELKKAQQRLAELEQQDERHRKRVSAAEEENRLLLQQLQSAQEEQGALTAQLAVRDKEKSRDLERKRALEEEKALVLQQLHALQEAHGTLTAQLEARDKESALALERREGLTAENRHLLEQLEAAQAELASERAKASAAPQTGESGDSAGPSESDAEARSTRLKEENDLLLQQLKDIQREFERCHRENDELRRSLEAAHFTIDCLYSSKSWKITRPLRQALELLTGTRSADGK